jgi:hypothetical protein
MSEELIQIQHLTPSQTPGEFSVVSEDQSPQLYKALAEFNHLLEEESVELPNVWGAIVVTDNQAGLKRLDWVVSWDFVQIELGNIVVDNDGNPVFVTETVDLPVLDENGEAVLDEDGNPLTESVTRPVRRIYSDHIFIHENAAYFD